MRSVADADDDGNGDGGGSYCGLGGIGFLENKGIVGKPYGGATLVPLVGGSRGGELEAGGAGGGALQLVAGNNIAIGKNGAVGARGQNGSRGGGGSGGALLLEAPTIEGNGRIDAQGGNGGASYFESPGVGPGGGKGGREANANGTNATEAYDELLRAFSFALNVSRAMNKNTGVRFRSRRMCRRAST